MSMPDGDPHARYESESTQKIRTERRMIGRHYRQDVRNIRYIKGEWMLK